MRRRQILSLAVVGVLTIFTCVAQAQELLNGSLELVFPDRGGNGSVPPGWQMEEGPHVPAQSGPYLADYNNGGVTVVPCPDRYCGAVDAADYVVWRKFLGQAVEIPNRHPNLVGSVIGEFDYSTWERAFGEPIALSLAEPGDFTHLLLEGDWHMWFQPYLGTEAGQEDNFAHLYQDVPATPGLRYTMTGFALFEDYFPGGVTNLNLETGGTPTGEPFDDGPPSPTDAFFALEFLDANDAVLAGSVEIELKAAGQPSNTTWQQHTLSAVAPAGTTKVRVRASMIDGVYNPLPSPQVFQMSFFVDAFTLTASAPSAGAEVVPEPPAYLLAIMAIGFLGALRRFGLQVSPLYGANDAGGAKPQAVGRTSGAISAFK